MNTFFLSLIMISGIIASLYFVFHNKKPTVDLKIGSSAPIFALLDETGTPRSLSDFKGKKVVLYFYPKDETPGCTSQACSLRDAYELYAKHNIAILGISYDSPESHAHFKEKFHLPFPLLSDSKHHVAHLYGADQHALGNLYPSRKTILINEQGVIIHIINDVSIDTHVDDVLKGFNI
ncbi:MAG: peroxiredoxin [Candidatus Babeliales bacterium]|nr:peroxiredoxin [Candidatus Babeliales bacterium]